jgi:hypothetical protein
MMTERQHGERFAGSLQPNARPTRVRAVCITRPTISGRAAQVSRRFESGGSVSPMKQMGTKLGRLKYRTAPEARAVADELGISGSHSHRMSGEKIHMPGRDHETLNKALESRGLPPTRMPGGDSGGMMGGMMGGSSAEAMPDPVADIEDPEPVFDLDSLTGDRDDDDNMEIY